MTPKLPVRDRIRRELSYWFGGPQLANPAKFSDLRPLPKLAVLGLAVTTPYHLMSWAVFDIPYYMGRTREDLYSRAQNPELDQAVNWQAFRLHESVVVGNNPLTWLYEASPIAAMTTMVGSLGFHIFAFRPLTRKFIGPCRSLLLADAAIAGYCLTQTWFCQITSWHTSVHSWVNLANGGA